MATDTVAQIKKRLSIQDIVSPYVKLTRAGKSVRGLCPFHKEKTPSFHVSPERGTWHCFGCGLGGDGFSFIEKIEGVDFKGALKMLAEKAGVKIEPYAGAPHEDTSKRERLYALMSRASEWYTFNYTGSPAEAYARTRAISDESAIAWRLGYAPDSWRALLEAFTAEGFTIPELLSAGLVKEADGKPGTYYDRFRNRLMFPIRDSAGRVVAFTGRALSSEDPAKYLNSPETDLYHKSDILFGFDRAKDAIRSRGFTMLVEGQIDVLMAHQAGFTNAVALSGTAFTEAHARLMKRFSENLLLVLDADPAGLAATARSAGIALMHALRVKAARLPSGQDPADLISEDVSARGGSASGGKEFTKRVQAAKPIVEFLLAELSDSEHDPHRLLRKAEGIVLPLIRAIPSPMERDHFIQITARSLGLSSEAVKESLRRLPAASVVTEVATAPRPTAAAPRSARLQRAEILLAFIKSYPDSKLAEHVKSEYARITEASELPIEPLPESALFIAEQTFGEDPSQEAVDELLHAFEQAVIREAYESAVANLRRAEQAGDPSRISEAQNRCAALSLRLASLGG